MIHAGANRALRATRATASAIVPAAAPAATTAAHFCPVCLCRVGQAEVQRRVHHETCRSGALDVSLLHCPACGLVLAAEVELPGGAMAAPAAA
jgi:hypothetical protein